MHTIRHRRQGSILIVAISTLAIVVASIGIAITVTGATARLSDRSQELAATQAGAEGVLEYGFAIWKARLAQQYRAISTAEANASLTVPTFPNLTATSALAINAADAYGAPSGNGAAVPMQIDVPGYPGWRGRGYNYVATARMRTTSTPGKVIEYGVKRYFAYTEVPLFQTMFFFEHDLELYRSNTMLIGGLTHTNRWGFVSNDEGNDLSVTFDNNVSHVLGFTNTTLPYRAETWSGYSSSSSANAPVEFDHGAQLTQVARLEPFGQDPSSVLDPAPTNSSSLSPSGQLIVPDADTDGNPNNDSMHELIEPPVTTGSPAPVDPPEIAKRRIYGKAGIIITVNGATKTVTTQNGATMNATQITTIKNAISTTASFYDQREQANIHVTNVDLSAIRTTLDATPGFNGVLYVDDVTPTTSNVPKNAIRLQKGGELPTNGLTVASQDAIYIQGDYNTGTTTSSTAVPANNNGNANNTDAPTVNGYTRKPAAVIADAVMILSNAWNDANASSAISARTASNTTVNAAFLAGFMPSGYKPANGSQYGYSGGANNYPRFLENWSNRYFTYFGSMVELFQSTSFTGRWDTGNIYAPPIRCWNYDTNFDSVSPPGSIDAVATSRGTWARF